jgi:outer membrane protein assembly factor BamB
VSGTTVVVGAYGETANALPNAGHAYVFDAIDGSLITTLTSPNAQADGDFGGSVSISGTLVVVGALGEAGNAGHAYVFNAIDGSLITTLTSPNTNALVNIFFFGASVSISGTTVVVGAYDDTTNGIPTNEGHA